MVKKIMKILSKFCDKASHEKNHKGNDHIDDVVNINNCLRNLKKTPDFNFHPKCEKLQTTNISFADDLLFFTRGDEISVKIMMLEFKKFYEASGLKEHPTKDKFYFGGVKEEYQKEIIETTRFAACTLPFKYSGV
ncbi:hypothetical protein KIW84_034210 [Lathyrus oleraceus]|uniref:Reverse transcriptase domain-containing protein n=1 Tax=Pisum sativum TaxID=3888 RepID=A0A9D4XXW0_PEA|nr:hypothetical protein KIW84_034210 [Pisum sativum]